MKNFTLLTFIFCFTLFSKAQNNPPTFTSSPIIGINEGEIYNYNIAVQDTDGNHVNISASTIPVWLSLETSIDVSTFAGSVNGDSDGTGIYAQFSGPKGVCSDSFGNIYVADTGNDKIRKISPEGVVTTLAGSTSGFADGTGSEAKFDAPHGITVDDSGNLFVADRSNHRIRKITPAGVVTTIAGNGYAGYTDGQGTDARFDSPEGIALDNNGYIYVADTDNHKIRRIDQNGNVINLAGGGPGDDDDVGVYANFWFPTDVAVDNNGDIYVADRTNSKIRKVTQSGVVTTYAGTGVNGDLDGSLSAAQFHFPQGITIDDFGNIFVVDNYNHKIKKISTSGLVSTIAGTSAGFNDGIGSNAQFRFPGHIAIDKLGNLYITDRDNQRIRKITTTYKLTGNTSGQIGIHDVSLQVNDPNGGSTNQIFTIEVVDGTPPTITSLSPPDNSTNIEIDTNFEITFNKNILKGSGDLLIKDASDDITVQTIDVASVLVEINGFTATVNPDVDLSEDKNYYIIIENSVFTDVANNAFEGILDSTTWNFDTTVSMSTLEHELLQSTSFYPNPVCDIMKIDSKLSIIDVTIVNQLGQKVKSFENIVDNEINLINLKKGVYFIRISTNKGVFTEKFIKK